MAKGGSPPGEAAIASYLFALFELTVQAVCRRQLATGCSLVCLVLMTTSGIWARASMGVLTIGRVWGHHSPHTWKGRLGICRLIRGI